MAASEGSAPQASGSHPPRSEGSKGVSVQPPVPASSQVEMLKQELNWELVNIDTVNMTLSQPNTEMRPRAFSDSSGSVSNMVENDKQQSGVKPSVERKQSMKIIFKRETEIISGPERGRKLMSESQSDSQMSSGAVTSSTTTTTTTVVDRVKPVYSRSKSASGRAQPQLSSSALGPSSARHNVQNQSTDISCSREQTGHSQRMESAISSSTTSNDKVSHFHHRKQDLKTSNNKADNSQSNYYSRQPENSVRQTLTSQPLSAKRNDSDTSSHSQRSPMSPDTPPEMPPKQGSIKGDRHGLQGVSSAQSAALRESSDKYFKSLGNNNRDNNSSIGSKTATPKRQLTRKSSIPQLQRTPGRSGTPGRSEMTGRSGTPGSARSDTAYSRSNSRPGLQHSTSPTKLQRGMVGKPEGQDTCSSSRTVSGNNRTLIRGDSGPQGLNKAGLRTARPSPQSSVSNTRGSRSTSVSSGTQPKSVLDGPPKPPRVQSSRPSFTSSKSLDRLSSRGSRTSIDKGMPGAGGQRANTARQERNTKADYHRPKSHSVANLKTDLHGHTSSKSSYRDRDAERHSSSSSHMDNAQSAQKSKCSNTAQNGAQKSGYSVQHNAQSEVGESSVAMSNKQGVEYMTKSPGSPKKQNAEKQTSSSRLLSPRTITKMSGGSDSEKPGSNLRRRQDVICKFNYSEVEEKHKKVLKNFQEKVKTHGIDHRISEELDCDSLSPGKLLDWKPDEKANEIKEEIDQENRSNVIHDNRSDEEKYAALSRIKIVHNKSSSLDSTLKDKVVKSEIRHPMSKTLDAISSLRFTSSQSLDSPRSLTTDDVVLDRTLQLDDDNSGGGGGLEPSLAKGQSVSSENLSTKVVLRQCRIGADVAFGLVSVQNNKPQPVPAPEPSVIENEIKPQPNGNSYLDGQGLVTLRMIPDDQGRFGFNVKGGADQGMPIIVSRVAPNTPADNAMPRLHEGDQVLFINGRDVSQHTHEQVVMFIRASRETHSGELVLKVRPNACVNDEGSEEPDLTYTPAIFEITSSVSGAKALSVSLKLLQESLESGAALAQFEQLYRRNPAMTMNAARLEVNIPKNRYRDISPYDQTRVILKNGANGDYINANYVNMEIPGSGIVNRYIAAQGPLPGTCGDFWEMVWEQQSTLVVMLTTKVERGRVKCHQYWPDLYDTAEYGSLQITCVKEDESASFAFREFNLTDVETQEERHISHMQYIAWPDHGVPDDPADFLEFVVKVRQKRVGIVEPSIVHCSAGIGRTGVLITMETAMCLIESNQPVYPLSIVRQMRDQRAMLIQTPSQYKFVCEAILRVVSEEIVKPEQDYQR